MTSSVNGTSSTTGTSSTASTGGGTSAADIQTSFLNLLVAQLQNQDPLNPMDNAAVTNQLAEINTVNGIQQLNTTMQSLLGTYSTSQDMQAASLVGHDVLSSGDTMDLASGTATGGFNLASDADTVKVTITGSNGQVVHTATLSDVSAGMQTFGWDGTSDSGTAATDGRYTFSVTATNAGQKVTADPLTVSHVYGVAGGANASTTGNTTLNTSTGSVTWSQVQQVM
jgi:flagellar basal-body rod modification protein FlgD